LFYAGAGEFELGLLLLEGLELLGDSGRFRACNASSVKRLAEDLGARNTRISECGKVRRCLREKLLEGLLDLRVLLCHKTEDGLARSALGFQ